MDTSTPLCISLIAVQRVGGYSKQPLAKRSRLALPFQLHPIRYARQKAGTFTRSANQMIFPLILALMPWVSHDDAILVFLLIAARHPLPVL